MRLTQGRFPEASQIHLHGQVGPRCTAELVGHFVGFSVTLGGFKVDGEGKDGLFRYSHQIGALLFGLLAAGVQLPAVRLLRIPMARKEAHAICVMCLIKWKIVVKARLLF